MANERLTKIYVKLIVIAALITVSVLMIWQKRPPLGLDLKGGTELIYRVRTEDLSKSEQVNVVERTIAVVRKRVDPDGSLGLSIRKHGRDRFYIQLPTMDPREGRRIEDIIRRAGKLRFCLVNRNEEDLARAEEGEPVPGHTPFLPAQKDAEGKVIRWRKGTYAQLAELPEDAGPWYLIENIAHVTGQYLVNPQPERDQMGQWQVQFSFRGPGRVQFERLTAENIGRELAIILDESLYSAPVVRDAISRMGTISGRFTQAEVEDLVATLRAGSLPANIELEWNNTVGAELGEDSIRAGLRACVIALALVLLFMAIYYLLTGLIADFALMLNLLLIVACMSGMQMVLTLPGLAGLVLTMGMAVDANVLINERIREEREGGKTLRLAIRSGYERAFVTILDSNLTTLITGLILFAVGTEAVAGFARTLCIGIVISMFTAIWVTRAIVDLLIELGWLKALRMLPVLARPHIPFSRIRHATMAASAVCIVVGLAFFAQGYATERLLDTDLTGGFRAEMQLRKGIPVDEFRERVSSIFEKPDVQSVWTAAGNNRDELPRRFAIRVRKLTDEQRNDKMARDIREVLGSRNLLQSLEEPQGVLWTFTATLSSALSEDEMRTALWDARYGEGNIERIVPTDVEATEFAVKLRSAAFENETPERCIARILNALDNVIVSQEVRLVEVGDIVRPERSILVNEDERREERPYLPLKLSAACTLSSLREAIAREYMNNNLPPDLDITGHGADKNAVVCREIAIRGNEDDLKKIAEAKKREIRVRSYSTTGPTDLNVTLKAATSETVIREELNESGLLAVTTDSGERQGLVRAVIPLGVSGKTFEIAMAPLSEDKVKEKIREDLLAAFEDELAATSSAASVEPVEVPGDVADAATWAEEGYEFFSLKLLDEPIQLQRLIAALSDAGAPDALVVDAQLSQAIASALDRTEEEDFVPDLNTSAAQKVKVDKVLLRLKGEPDELNNLRERIVASFEDTDPFRSINTIGDRVSKEMKTKAAMAIVFSCIAIVFYIWFRFGEVKFGLAAVVALVHDVLLTAGAVGIADVLSGTAVGNLLGFSDIKLNVTMIAAFLTLIGYSINDTIVVFDRIRENMGGVRRRVDAELVDRAVNQILSRTLLTSFTTFMVLIVLYVVGGPVVHGFAFVMTFGVIVGTYSSIFIASPILIGWETFTAFVRKFGRIVTFRFD